MADAERIDPVEARSRVCWFTARRAASVPSRFNLPKAMGAGSVVGSANTEEKRQFARDLGADAAIDDGADCVAQ